MVTQYSFLFGIVFMIKVENIFKISYIIANNDKYERNDY